jgi:hypothetical protein
VHHPTPCGEASSFQEHLTGNGREGGRGQIEFEEGEAGAANATEKADAAIALLIRRRLGAASRAFAAAAH